MKKVLDLNVLLVSTYFSEVCELCERGDFSTSSCVSVICYPPFASIVSSVENGTIASAALLRNASKSKTESRQEKSCSA